MKKILAAILLSLSALYITGCTDIGISGNSSQASQPSVQSSQDTQPSKNESSQDERSDNKNSADENSDSEASDKKSSSDENSGKEVSEAESSDEEGVDEESSEIDLMEEADIFNFRIKIDDTVYQLPFDYAELEDNGYYLNRDGELSPETYSRSMEWKNEDGKVISTQLWNPSNKPKDYEECKIGSIEIKLSEEMAVIMPGNFSFDLDVTPEKIKEQYGEPESEHIYNDYVTLRYKVDLSKTIEFFIYTNENYIKFSSVTVKNFS